MELYMWYAMHAENPGKIKGKQLLAPKATLQRQIAKVKVAIRKVMVFCIDMEDECIFKTCRSRQHRLNGLAISNKHACIQGMPVITNEDAEAITEEILQLKGVISKKQKEAHHKGILKIK